MFKPIKVIDVDLAEPVQKITGLAHYRSVKALVRLHGTPLGYANIPITVDSCAPETIRHECIEQTIAALVRYQVLNGLARNELAACLAPAALLEARRPTPTGPWPAVSIAVCSRDRAEDLRLCLEALAQVDYPEYEILVIDNAPKTDATRRLVEEHFPQVRYFREEKPGLDWARNRAIEEARHPILAYTDDDVVVDPSWVRGLVEPFLLDPTVMAVTGLVVPYELESEAQLLFEMHGGFGRGFKRRWIRPRRHGAYAWAWRGTGDFGTGANMAFRRQVFDAIGRFDPALDVGTVTNGGGDLEMLYRVLHAGHTLVYEPEALVRHRHRRELARLRTQLENNGTGFVAYMQRCVAADPDEKAPFRQLQRWWMVHIAAARTVNAAIRPERVPFALRWAEAKGSLRSRGVYRRARANAQAIATAHGLELDAIDRFGQSHPGARGEAGGGAEGKTGYFHVRLNDPAPNLEEAERYDRIKLFVEHHDGVLGEVEINNCRRAISAAEIHAAVADDLVLKSLLWLMVKDALYIVDRKLLLGQEEARRLWQTESVVTTAAAEVDGHLDEKQLVRMLLGVRYSDLRWPRMPTSARSTHEATAPAQADAPSSLSVSIVIATFDRPDDLYECLRHLRDVRRAREVEIIVVDNHPVSGRTPPVVAAFPEVTLVQEERQGLGYARNAGIVASRGDIIVMTDDDVIVQREWLERLVAPFAHNHVMAAMGNVVPAELETAAQQLFEAYGGLGRGETSWQVDGDWFQSFRREAVPTWRLGATANAAFRAEIFHSPTIGLMDVALGPGQPSGVGEDTYLLYRVLKAGYTVAYQGDAFVYHKHRRTMRALWRQIYGYSKGHVAYNLTTALRDGDLRGLQRLAVGLPYGHFYRVRERLRGRSNYTLLLLLLEMWGNLVGPFALIRSRRRVQRAGGYPTHIVSAPARRAAHRSETASPPDGGDRQVEVQPLALLPMGSGENR